MEVLEGALGYDIWSGLGIGIPYKVYLGSAINLLYKLIISFIVYNHSARYFYQNNIEQIPNHFLQGH